MIKKTQKLGITLEKIANKTLLVIAFLILVGLSYYSMRYTEILKPQEEVPVTIRDSALQNILTLAATVLLFFLARTLVIKKCKSDPDKFCSILIPAITLLVAVISLGWVSICHVKPRADGSSVCSIASSILEGSGYGFMNAPAYMSYNPHLYGLLTVIQILFSIFGIDNYHAFQYMNALCMPLLFYSGYKIIMLIYEKWEPVLYYILFFISFLPLFLYVPFVYGEITSITFTMILLWQVIKYCKTGSNLCFLWGTLALVFACIMRMNSLIVLIAAGIVLLIYALRSAKWQACLWLAIMALAVSAANTGIHTYYEKVSGLEVCDGIPHISYILMGLEDTEAGPGWFNGTNYTQWIQHDYDTDLTAADSTLAVQERLKIFWNDKPYAIDFFRRKILSQWNSPAYNSLFETSRFNCEKEELPEVVQQIYYDKEMSVNAFLNRYQFILFICTTVMIAIALLKKNTTTAIENGLLIVAIVGGFLFSALWEAKSRYVLPYVVYMIPLAAVGMWQLQQGINTLCKRIQNGEFK